MAERVTGTAGDCFTVLPPSADAILLKGVLHDWNDMDAALILRRAECRRP